MPQRQTHDLDDRELVSRYRKGDVSAFETLLGRYEKPLLRFAARCRPAWAGDGARDIVQEVFLKLLREARRPGALENPGAWLYRVTRNLSIDRARKETRMEKHQRLVAAPEVERPPPTRLEREEIDQIVAGKLERLPPNQRDVLILKVQEGKSYREIAEITGLTTSNIGYLIHHGLKRLGGELRKAGVV